LVDVVVADEDLHSCNSLRLCVRRPRERVWERRI
jgi:hypothetical protein